MRLSQTTFAHHHLGVPEELVLVAIEVDRRVEELEVEVVVELDPLLEVGLAAVEVVADQLVAERVRVGDEVRAGRVEGVDEAARLADQRPAIGREDPRGRVGEVLHAQEVEDVLAAPVDLVVDQRLVLPASTP